MEDRNPYAPPQAEVADITSQPDGLMEEVAVGQKRMIWAILLQLGDVVLSGASASAGLATTVALGVVDLGIGIIAFCFAISGLCRCLPTPLRSGPLSVPIPSAP